MSHTCHVCLCVSIYLDMCIHIDRQDNSHINGRLSTRSKNIIPPLRTIHKVADIAYWGQCSMSSIACQFQYKEIPAPPPAKRLRPTIIAEEVVAPRVVPRPRYIMSSNRTFPPHTASKKPPRTPSPQQSPHAVVCRLTIYRNRRFAMTTRCVRCGG